MRDDRRTRDLIFFVSSEEPDAETTVHPATKEREKKTDYSPNRDPNPPPLDQVCEVPMMIRTKRSAT